MDNIFNSIHVCSIMFTYLIQNNFRIYTVFIPLEKYKGTYLLVFIGVLPQIILCLKEQHQNLKLCALSVLDEIAKHNQDLAQTIVEIPTLPHIMNYLSQNCTDIKVQVTIINV